LKEKEKEESFVLFNCYSRTKNEVDKRCKRKEKKITNSF